MMVWTDERMDDLASRMGAGFERIDNDIRELRGEVGALRTEMHAGFRDLRAELKGDIGDLRAELKGDISDLRAELKGDIGELRAELEALRTLVMRVGIAMMVGMIGVIATLVGVVATGALGG